MNSEHMGVSCKFYLDSGGSTMSVFLTQAKYNSIGAPAEEWPPTGNYTSPFIEGTTIFRIVEWFNEYVSDLDMPHGQDFEKVTRVEIEYETDGRPKDEQDRKPEQAGFFRRLFGK